MKNLLKAMLFLGAALPASADTALVIGTQDASSTVQTSHSHRVLEAVDPLSEAGFVVYNAQDPKATQILSLFSDVIAVGEEDRLIIILSGRFVNFGGNTWYLGRFAGPVDLGHVSGAGLPVNLVLDYVASISANTIVMLAPDNQLIPVGDGLEAGLGEIDVPNGVTVVSGNPWSISRLAGRELLTPGRPLRRALNATSGLNVLSVHQPNISFVDAPVTTPTIPEGDQSYWDAMSTLDNVFAYRAYLNRYPDGYYAAEAYARIAVFNAVVDEPTPEEVENDLGLSRNQKRDIQRDLSVLGHYSSGIDGLFGPGSRGGIREWQSANGLEITGYLDAAQITRLHDQAEVRRIQIQAEDRAYWRQTGRGQDIAGLRAYLDRYPNGEFSELARNRLSQMEHAAAEPQAWQDALAANTISAYREFLEDYPDSPRRPQALNRIDALQASGASWQQAEDQDTIQAYRDYIADNPNSPHVQEARTRIAAIRADNQAWRDARDTGTNLAYAEYLDAYPQGRHVSDAWDQLVANAATDSAMGEMNPIQRQLAARGLYRSGIMQGPPPYSEAMTIVGLRLYQRAVGIPNSGIMDQRTIADMTIRGYLLN